MGSKPTPSGRSSIVSLDPVIASHIITKTSTTAQHTRAESSPNTRTVSYAKGHGRNNSAPSKHVRKRSNSLRRAKNSTEILRQRSTRGNSDARSPDSAGDNKRGRNFTVTNVGTGGFLYLRPSAHQAPMSPTLTAPPLGFPNASAPDVTDNQKQSQPPGSQSATTQHGVQEPAKMSRTRSVSPKRLLQRMEKMKADAIGRPIHRRSQSFSTLDESRRSLTTSWPKTLKIIINRGSDRVQPSPDLNAKPSLEIPIPHYRLGVPRFSAHGTPMLRNSAFSRNSSTASIRPSSNHKSEPSPPAPPPASLKAFAKLQTLDPSISLAPVQNPTESLVNGVAPTTPPFEMPLSPSIYDDLTVNYNDPSVVRFAHDVRDVTAASPARIIAQISSESFMDYELVSDFFLTFRSYMSIMEVLNLLLARLAWAIGRMSDDGRIIRIRTFAALRHWILNYFMDDFASNRRVRVRFCDEINDLYKDVQNKRIGGPSDLKILQDLKRCWNGRCSLYWDDEAFNTDDGQDTEIRPGGVIGSRNPDHTDISEVEMSEHEIPIFIPPRPVQAHEREELSEPVKRPLHPAQQSLSTSSRQVESMHSEQSIQAQSCSFLRNPLRNAAQTTLNMKRPHPVTVLERRQNAPSDLQVTTGRPNSQIQQHRRGGSSFDSTRERTPYEAPTLDNSALEHYEGSVIRGYVFGPVEPFVRVPPTMPMSPFGGLDAHEKSPAGVTEPGAYLASNYPTTKNIFGSIRRAISGRQGPNEVTMITISAPYSNQSLAGRKSPMPLNISRSQDELQRKAAGLSPLSPVRIDLLCAAAIESYQANVPGTEKVVMSKAPLESSGAKLAPPQASPSHIAANLSVQRVGSHVTAQSGSILIVDETGMGMPEMSGALQDNQKPHGIPSPVRPSGSGGVEQDRHASYATEIAFEDGARDIVHRNVIDTQTVDRKTPVQGGVDTAGDVHSSTASTTTFKNPQSMISSQQLNTKASHDGGASEITAPQDYQVDSTAPGASAPTQVLRRRPGGDLRKNQNVHELEAAVPHHESLDSMVDTVSSHAESLVVMTNAPLTQAYTLQKVTPTQVSMIHTHSSQHLRPSFEAAVAPFSAIPDDDDGGLEATLLKLEGRYDKESPNIRQHSPYSAPSEVFSGSTTRTDPYEPDNDSTPIVGHGYQQELEPPFPVARKSVEARRSLVSPTNPLQLFVHDQGLFELPHDPVMRLGSSRDFSPLLQRDSGSAQNTATLPQRPFQSTATTNSPMRMSNIAHRQEFMNHLAGLRSGGSSRMLLRPETSQTEHSFLLDEDENMSDLSSEMSVDIVDYSEAMGRASSAMLVAPGTAVSGLEIPSHPLAHSSFVNLSMHPSLALDAGPESLRWSPTPEPSPTASNVPRKKVTSMAAQTTKDRGKRSHIPVGPAHIPFVLACDSSILAQQLTLIEQSALTEVEWSDLVEMRWSNKPANILDWAEYVTQQDVKGVDLVITRFNLMVKWAISEIVLTLSAEERVRVITKFIHVAAHARRLHNYATMLQLTIALTSTDCSRLVKTWQLVSGPDKSLLKNMEALIQPVRNFHDLRVEMESADLSAGCVPFIEIDAGKGQPPLINFERFRTAAVIVKGLLRLIDASSRYEFEPIHGIIERCLWIAALEDEQVRTLSRTCEENLEDKEVEQ